jgi:hypothetical protein
MIRNVLPKCKRADYFGIHYSPPECIYLCLRPSSNCNVPDATFLMSGKRVLLKFIVHPIFPGCRFCLYVNGHMNVVMRD